MRRITAVTSVVAITIGALAVVAPEPAASAPSLSGSAITAVPFASGLDTPVDIATRKNDARLYVAEKGGTIRIVNTNGTLVSTPVLTLAVATDGEQGLLGITFSPGGAKLYVDYAAPGTGAITVAEYLMAAVSPTSGRGANSFRSRTRPTPTTTAAICVSGATACSTSRPVTAAAAATRTTTRKTSTPCSARSSGSA